MAFTTDEITQLKEMMVATIIETVAPMFEHQTEELGGRMDGLENRMGSLESKMGSLEGRMDGLENRMGSLEGRMDGLENEFHSFKVYVEGRFVDIDHRLRELSQKIDDQTATLQERIENMSEDIDLLSRLAAKLDSDNKAESDFARLTIDHQVPILFRQLQAIAKKAGIDLKTS